MFYKVYHRTLEVDEGKENDSLLLTVSLFSYECPYSETARYVICCYSINLYC